MINVVDSLTAFYAENRDPAEYNAFFTMSDTLK
jgi:hypothetical protein